MISRALLAVAAGFAIAAATFGPLAAAEPASEAQRALDLINTPCVVALAEPAASPAASPSPTASPSAPPAPVIPVGPGVLVPPALPVGSAPATPPPLPSPSPTGSTTPLPVFIAPVTPTPVPTPAARPTSGPVQPAPSPSPPAVPTATETLGPGDYAILGDEMIGNRSGPWDLDGNVNVLYGEGALIGDHAHYDGQRYIDVTGHTYLRNTRGDTTLAADSIRFDSTSQRATLINGRGVTSQGVQHGLLHYSARSLVTERDGRTHGERASFSTCENPRGGYHVEARTLDITPGDKAIAKKAVLFLGGVAVFFLPVVIIPLRHDPESERRAQGFIPLIGYSQAEGYYVKARLGFGPSPYYYGYYRVEGYTRIGFGLGYVATIIRRDGRRTTNIDSFRLKNKFDGTQNTNLNINDQENFSKALRGTAQFSYQGNYGPLLSLPPSLSLALGLTHTDPRGTENYSYARQSTGSQIITNNYGFGDTFKISPALSNALTMSFTSNSNNYSGTTNTSTNLHVNTDTHLTSRLFDYDLTVDRYNAATPSGVNKLPELLVRPHGALFPRMRYLPTTATFTLGEYSDATVPLATQRGEAQLNFGPALLRTDVGDFNATVNVRQDAYGTGDAKAQVQQQINLVSGLGRHASNTLSYSNQHVNGLGNEPFTFDSIGGVSKALQEVFRIYNGNAYALTLQSGTGFNRQAQPIGYQLLARPLAATTVLAGGNWYPGAGAGFDRTNVQVATPFGRSGDIQFSTFVDWKTSGRLENKNIYIRRIIGDCYEVRIAYNQDLKTVNVTVDLLAFPQQALNFGLGQQTSIIPQSFATNQFFGR